MTTMHTIDRAAAEAKGYRTTTASEFELAEFLRYVHGDPDHLYRPRAEQLASTSTPSDLPG